MLLISGLLALQGVQAAHEAQSNELNPSEQIDDVLRRTDATHEKLHAKRRSAESERQYSLAEREYLEKRRRQRDEQTQQYFGDDRDFMYSHEQPYRLHDGYYNYVLPETTRSMRIPASAFPYDAESDPKANPKKPSAAPAKRKQDSQSERHRKKEQRIREQLERAQEEHEREQAEQERREQAALEKRIRDQLDEERKADEERIKRDEERRKRRREAKKRRRELAQKEEEERQKALDEAAKAHEREHETRRREAEENQSSSSSERSTDRKIRDQAANNILSKYLYLEAKEAADVHLALPTTSEAHQMHRKHNSFMEDLDFVIDPRYQTDVEEDSEGELEFSNKGAEPDKDLYYEHAPVEMPRYRDDFELDRRHNYEPAYTYSRDERSYNSLSSQTLYTDSSSSVTSSSSSHRTSSSSSSSTSTLLSTSSVERHVRHDIDAYYERELKHAHSDEEHLHEQYKHREDVLKHAAEDAERDEHDARHKARDTHDRAHSAEDRAREAEQRAELLERQAREAQERADYMERQVREAEERVHEVELEWQRAERKAQMHEQELRDAQRRAEIENHERRLLQYEHDDVEDLTKIIDGERYLHPHELHDNYENVDEFYDSDRGEILEEEPDSIYDPIQFIRHDSSRHEKIIKERQQQQQQKQQQQQQKQKPEKKSKAKDTEQQRKEQKQEKKAEKMRDEQKKYEQQRKKQQQQPQYGYQREVPSETKPRQVERQEREVVPEQKPRKAERQEREVVPEQRPRQAERQEREVVPEQRPRQAERQEREVVPEQRPRQAERQEREVVPEQRPRQAERQEREVVREPKKEQPQYGYQREVIPEPKQQQPQSRQQREVVPEQKPRKAERQEREVAPEPRQKPVERQQQRQQEWDQGRREQTETQKKMGQWGHAETYYPPGYTQTKYEETYMPSKAKAGKDVEAPYKQDKREEAESRSRPKTVYPPGYTPPVISKEKDFKPWDQSSEEEFEDHDFYFPTYHYVPEQKYFDESYYYKGDIEQERDFTTFPRSEPRYGRQHYKVLESNTIPRNFLEDESPLSMALMETNERERQLSLHRLTEEQQLKDEYDHRIDELAEDYRAKLRELDDTYMEKRYALDAERQEIERNVEIARETIAGQPQLITDTSRAHDVDPTQLHKVDSANDTVFNFINDRPIVAGLNLAHKPHAPKKNARRNRREKQADQTPLDPMTDIKRRERFLQKERLAREQELQREYEQRLQEFELDFQERERELEKEKLYQERRLIAEREHEIELERQDARRRHREDFGPDDDDDLYEDEPVPARGKRDHGRNSDDDDEDDDSEDDSSDEDDSDDDDSDEDDDESDKNGDADIAFDSEFNEEEDETQFYNTHQYGLEAQTDPILDGPYQIEWELDLVPKRVVPKPQPQLAPVLHEKERKPKRQDKRGGGRQPQRQGQRKIDYDDQQQHRQGRRHDRAPRQTDRDQERRPRKNKRNRNRRNEGEQYEEEFVAEPQHRHHHHANDMDFDFDFHGQKDHHGEQPQFIKDEQTHYMEQHARTVPEQPHIDYEPDVHYYLVLESHLAGNEMSTRTFPKLKTETYDPEALAKSLAKARAESTVKKPQEEEEEFDYHKQTHRHQTHSFEIHQPVDPEDEAKAEKAEEIRESLAARAGRAQMLKKKQDRQDDKKYLGEPKGHGLKAWESDKTAEHSTSQPTDKTADYLASKPTAKIEEHLASQPQAKTTEMPRRTAHRVQTKPFDIQKPVAKTEKEVPSKEHEVLKTEPERKQPVAAAPVESKEQKEDMIPKGDLSSGPFMARRDPFSIDFERIAAERAAKQYQFKRQEEDEQKPWDEVHGGRFSYKGEHMAEDREMKESKEHVALHKAFEASQEEYHKHQFSKPSFEAFRLKFEGTHSQVADLIPSQSDDKTEQMKKEEIGTHHSMKEEEHMNPRSAQHHYHGRESEQKRLEELGIGLNDDFFFSSKDKMLSLPQSVQNPKAPAAPKKTVSQPEGSHPMTTPPAPPSLIGQNQKPEQSVASKPQYPSQLGQPGTVDSQATRTTVKETPEERSQYDEFSSTPSLDLAKESKFSKQEQMDTGAQQDLQKHHYWQGQRHEEHKFSLMDPVHPAVHDRQEQIYDKHFMDADLRREAARAAQAQGSHTPAEFELPEFDPQSVFARVQQQRAEQQPQLNPEYFEAAPYQAQQFVGGMPQMQQPQQQFAPLPQQIQSERPVAQEQPPQLIGYFPQAPQPQMQTQVPYYAQPQMTQQQQPVVQQPVRYAQPEPVMAYEPVQPVAMPIQQQPQQQEPMYQGQSTAAMPVRESQWTQQPKAPYQQVPQQQQYQQQQAYVQPQIAQQPEQISYRPEPVAAVPVSTMSYQRPTPQPVPQMVPQPVPQPTYQQPTYQQPIQQQPIQVERIADPVQYERASTSQEPQQSYQPQFSQGTSSTYYQPQQATPTVMPAAVPQSSTSRLVTPSYMAEPIYSTAMQQQPEITMTRQVTANQVYSLDDHQAEHHPRRDMGDFYSHKDVDYEHRHRHHDHDMIVDEAHPVVVVDTEPHSYTAHSGDTFTVADQAHEQHTGEEILHELSEISHWLTSHFGFSNESADNGPQYHDMFEDIEQHSEDVWPSHYLQ